MYVLDTDIFTFFSEAHPLVIPRVLSKPDSIWLSVITVEEAIGGTISAINTVRGNKGNLVEAYAFLPYAIRQVQKFRILEYCERSEKIFRQMPDGIRKREPNDCKIGAIAIANGMIVVTHNTQHFEQMPGVSFEDWAVDPDFGKE